MDPDGCADPWAPQQPGEMGWQEPHKLQQEVQGPAPLEQQLQAQEGAGANQLANSLAEILPWLPHIPPGVPSSPSKGSRWYLPASSSDCLDLCRSPWRDVKTVISRSWHEVSCAVKGTQASAQGVQMETNRTCA